MPAAATVPNVEFIPNPLYPTDVHVIADGREMGVIAEVGGGLFAPSHELAINCRYDPARRWTTRGNAEFFVRWRIEDIAAGVEIISYRDLGKALRESAS